MANEKRLIDANTLPVMEEGICDAYGNVFGAEKFVLFEDIENAPTVDAVEVVHGRWIELPSMEPDYNCSECGCSYAWWEPSEAHYCPHCGAKMDGEGNG